MKPLPKHALSILSILAILSGCKGEVEGNLIREITQKCANQPRSRCKVALKDAAPFSWDKLYLFGSWTTSEAIAEAIGLEYQGTAVPDDYRRMLFIQGGKVVHEEDFESLDYYNSTIYFPELIDSLSQARTPFLTPATALFIADKGKIEQSCEDCFFYSLSVLPVAH
jgi:hypothetical protein